MLSLELAYNTIAAADNQYRQHKKDFDTQDIIDLMIWADKQEVAKDTQEFARHVTPDMRGMMHLYTFLRDNIRYKADPKGAQWVKSPARLLHERLGDCKSFTLFITSIAQNLGLDYIIRFAKYRRYHRDVKHVYPVIILPSGREVVMDVVYALQEGGRFDQEKKYIQKIDYMKPAQGLAYLSGVGSSKEPETILDAIAEIETNIPDAIVSGEDVTTMTEGELQRFLMSQRLMTAADKAINPRDAEKYRHAAGIVKAGDTAGVSGLAGDLQSPVFSFLRQTAKMQAPAMRAPKLRFNSEEEIAAVAGGLKKFFKKIGKGAKKVAKGAKTVVKTVGNLYKKAWQKLLNFIFKGGLQKAGPFFLFTYLPIKMGVKFTKAAWRKIKARRDKQNKTKEFMIKLGCKRSNVDAAITNGIIQHGGAKPERILSDAAGQRIGESAEVGAVVAAIAQAAGWIIQIVQKLSKLFKKKSPAISKADNSDLSILGDAAAKSGKRSIVTSNAYSTDDYDDEEVRNEASSGGGGGAIGIAAAIAALLLLRGAG